MTNEISKPHCQANMTTNLGIKLLEERFLRRWNGFFKPLLKQSELLREKHSVTVHTKLHHHTKQTDHKQPLVSGIAKTQCDLSYMNLRHGADLHCCSPQPHSNQSVYSVKQQ